MNALDVATIRSLESAVRAADDETTSIVLTGGERFCAGVDREFYNSASSTEREELATGLNALLLAIVRSDVPIVAAIDGFAVGGGLAIALSCDARVLASSAFVSMPEASAGIAFPSAAAVVVERSLSGLVVDDLVLTGRRVHAQEADRVGIANDVVDQGDLVDVACQRAAALAEQPGFAVVKAQIRTTLERNIAAIVEAGNDPVTALWPQRLGE